MIRLEKEQANSDELLWRQLIMKIMEELKEESKVSKKKMEDMEEELMISKDERRLLEKKLEDLGMTQYLYGFAAGVVVGPVLSSVIPPDALASFYGTFSHVVPLPMKITTMMRLLGEIIGADGGE
jgi:hypothetical protein